MHFLQISCSLLALVFATTSGEKTNNFQDSFGERACMNTPSGGLAPHPSNCYAYFKCSGDSGEYRECNAGQFFNPESQICDDWDTLPLSTPCLKDSLEDSLVLASTTEAYAPVCNASSFPYKVPNPNDCHSYFVCLVGRYEEFTCPGEQYFNPDPSVDDCQVGLPTSSPCLANTPPPETTTPMVTPAPEACKNKTNGTCIDIDGYCDIYYICVDEMASDPIKCPTGFYSDPLSCTCKFPENATSSNCYVTPPPTTTTAPNYPICIGREDGETIADPSDCAGYFICNQEVATRNSCPPPLYFDATLKTCAGGPPPTPCRPPLPTEVCKTADPGTYLRDPTSCISFYICAGNTAFRQDCPPSRQPLFFEEKLKACVPRALLLVGTTCSIPLKDRCTIDPPDTHKFGIAADCTDYYTCTDGVPVQAAAAEKCPTYFDPFLQDCSANAPPAGYCP